MKLCYLDESGTEQEPYLVMAGIIVDSQRMHVTKKLWNNFLDYLSEQAGREIREFHCTRFYRGAGPYSSMGGNERARIISAVLNWIELRKHKIAFSAVDKIVFDTHDNCGDGFPGLSTPWCSAALHVILSLQRAHQGIKKNKGNTIIVFDHHKDRLGISEIVYRPPEWTDSYYSKNPKKSSLCQIVDVPFFVDSEHGLLIQIADLVSYLLRTYAELECGYRAEKYDGEQTRMMEWKNQIISSALPMSTRYPKRGRCEAAQLFWDIAPECLRI